ncbi:MerR family transcriptional regulator [Niveibacterium sp. SC-1]|uniref:MerR family transcriptional regulator n=1 Tax=Niveibacterium sp. SC-1 TaxID=3135646 RepID=UPI00311F1807
MQIGELAQATGLSPDALRYYERRGLLRAHRRTNGYRDYPAETVEWLSYVRTAQALGFSLAEIAADLPELLAAGDPGPALQAVLARKLAELDARIAGLADLRARLAERLASGAPCPLQVTAA